MDDKKTREFLKNNPVFWSRLGFCYDPPMKDADNKPLVFSKNFEKYAKLHRDFSKLGVKIHTSILHSGWVGVNEYDYSLTDKVLESVFHDNNDIYYMPRIKLNVPIEWCRENPEELFVYFEGPREKEEIRSLVGTLKHDYLGAESENGYASVGEYKDPRPNVGGLISLQSFSSKKWLHDAGEALERLINHIETLGYSDRIIGYHIGFGACGETTLWGRASNRYGDYGITNRREFYKWGLEKYKSQQALESAWEQNNLTGDNILIPSPEKRAGKTDKFDEFVRSSHSDIICIDYDEFMSQVNADAIIYFSKIAKKTKKLVGSFYGYYLHVENAAYTGHLAIDRLLDSPYIDFLAAPKSYYRCNIANPGGELCDAQSINLKKLWVDELDNRTHLANETVERWQSKNEEETKSIMLREFSKNLSHDSGFWWMDLGGGWYSSDSLREHIKKLVELNARLRPIKHESRSDVLIVTDEKTAMYSRASLDLLRGFAEDFIYETQMSGVLCDMYRINDLESIDLSGYKLVVFAYTLCIDYAQYERIVKKMNTDVTIMFNYAVGIHSENGFDKMNVQKITGCEIEEDKNPCEYDFPQIKIKKKISQNNKRIMNVTPYIKRDEIREIAKRAGCHIYTDEDNTVLFGDNRFLAVFNNDKINLNVEFPCKKNVYDVVCDVHYKDVDNITLDMKKVNRAFLIFED